MANIKTGINQEIIQDINRSLLLKCLRKEGMCSRAHLAKLTKLKQATITNIMKDFIEWDLVREVGFLSGQKGRRSIGIEVNEEKFRVIGVRLARHYYSIGLFNLKGACIQQEKVDIATLEKKDPKYVIEMICLEMKKIVKVNKKDEILAVGVSIPGPYIKKKNKVGVMTETQGWQELDIQYEFSKAINVPIYTEHDAKAGAFAYMWDLKESYKDEILVYIAAGQGIGSGIIIDGEIYQGTIGTSGEIGHMTIQYDGPQCECGNKGCLEKFSSSIAFSNSVNSALGVDNKYSFEEIREMAQQGNQVCLDKYREACRFIGYGVTNLINLYNPALVVLGDEMITINSDIMLEEVRNVVKSRVISEVWDDVSIRINQNERNRNPMLHGAAMIAINQVFEMPDKFISKKKETK